MLIVEGLPKNFRQMGAGEDEEKNLKDMEAFWKVWDILKTEEGSKIKKGKELTASIEARAEAARKIVPSLGDNQREAEMPRRPWDGAWSDDDHEEDCGVDNDVGHQEVIWAMIILRL